MSSPYSRPHTRREILTAARNCARLAECRLRDLRGMTLESVFAMVETGETLVYWGFWTDEDLATIIG